MAHRFKRRIILFLDGTWNRDDEGAPTNIVRMREALKIGVDRALAQQASNEVYPATGEKKASGSIIVQPNGSLIEYIVYYDRGVGTGPLLDRIRGGMFGDGLESNIRKAYRFLREHYGEGDEILIFGFSRGAFTARSVVSYLFAVGLLKPQSCTAAREAQAWHHYRTKPGDRHCGDWYALREHMFDHGTITIKFLGVFDTVGALGIPLRIYNRSNQERYAFHNTELSSIVENSFHAVAIDEHRIPFEAALWQRPKFKHYPAAHVEQVWFPGAHADIGGGYSDWSRQDGERVGRQDIAYEWMVDRVRACVPGIHFPSFDKERSVSLRLDRAMAEKDMLHRPWLIFDLFRKPACRMINQVAPSDRKNRYRPVGLMPHAEPIGEAVHVSAIELLNAPCVKEEGRWRGTRRPYRPANLLAVLPVIAATYSKGDPTGWDTWMSYLASSSNENREVLIIDWNGEPIRPGQPWKNSQDRTLAQLIPKPADLGWTSAT